MNTKLHPARKQKIMYKKLLQMAFTLLIISSGALCSNAEILKISSFPAGVEDARKLCQTSNPGNCDAALASFFVSGFEGRYLLLFTKEFCPSFPFDPWIGGNYEIEVGLLSGCDFGATEVFLNGRKAAAVPASAPDSPAEAVALRFSSGKSMPGNANTIELRPSPGGRVALLYMSKKFNSFKNTSAGKWKFSLLKSEEGPEIKIPEYLKKRLAAGYPESAGNEKIEWKNSGIINQDGELSVKNIPEDRIAVFTTHFFGEGLVLKFSSKYPAAIVVNGIVLMNAQTACENKVFTLENWYLSPGMNRLSVILKPSGGEAGFKLMPNDSPGLNFFDNVPEELNAELGIKNYPETTISNGMLTVKIATPGKADSYYRGLRFEQAGMITSLKFNGHEYSAEFPVKNRNPLMYQDASGPAEEFQEPLGFYEAESGGPFLKIGVGLLQKVLSNVYHHYTAYYPVERFPWEIETHENSMCFVQKVQDKLGWSYDYRKTVRLEPDKPVMHIEHEFKNTGSKRIITNHYNHNFTLIDNKPPSEDYKLEFAFTPIMITGVFPRSMFRGKTVTIQRKLFDGVSLAGFKTAEDNRVKISDSKTGASVEISGDFTPYKYNLYVADTENNRAICPEPFILIDLKPGESIKWAYKYEFK